MVNFGPLNNGNEGLFPRTPAVGEIYYSYPDDPGGPRPIVWVGDDELKAAANPGDELRVTLPVKLVSCPDLRWGGEVYAWVPALVDWPPQWVCSTPWPPAPPGSLVLVETEALEGALSTADGGQLSVAEDEEDEPEVSTPGAAASVERTFNQIDKELRLGGLTLVQWVAGSAVGVALALALVSWLWRMHA